MMANGLVELEELYHELSLLTRPLEELLNRFKRGESFKKLQKDIRSELDDIEDTIAKCITTHMAAKRRNLFGQLFRSRASKESSINLAQKVKEVRKKKLPLLRKYLGRLSNLPEDATDRANTEAIRKRRLEGTQQIVGYVEETKCLINILNSKSSHLKVASIVGMAGLGKTTLARKVFEDPVVREKFPIRIWVDISDDHNMENVLLAILGNSITSAGGLSIAELTEKVKDYLKDKKFLIVMDDIWTSTCWDDIKCILPMDNESSRDSRVLITTRHTDVATHVSNELHYLRFLRLAESWEIIQYVVYGELDVVPEEFVIFGKVIAARCDGHPLSVVEIGKKLKLLRDVESWKEVSVSLNEYLFAGDNSYLSSCISLSYKTLTFELRTCLLYLGVFPSDATIPVNKLLRLWIAEGLVLKKGDSLEKSALENLKELINRNLVMVEETKYGGAPKKVHIHNLIREFCKEEAKYESLNLFLEITKLSHENIEDCRRVCVHSHVLDFFERNKKMENVNSFLSFPHHPMLIVNMSSLIDGFEMLRVYDAPSIMFQAFPQKFVQLIHLRYLILVLEKCTSLPEVISDLCNLQTLVIHVSSDAFAIKADIWMMRQLRHLKTKASITLKKEATGKGCGNLQTLSRLSPESFTREVAEKATKLTVLGIQGELNKLSGPHDLGDLVCLEKLKLVNKVPNGVAAEYLPLFRPTSMSYPPNLKILVLTATYMQWTEMSILSMLDFLEVLKLKENAFDGTVWESTGIFKCLKCLHIETATKLLTWEANTQNPFPELKILFLYKCERLNAIPTVLYDNLDRLSMEHVTGHAISCAREKKAGRAFKLEIAPRDLSRGK